MTICTDWDRWIGVCNDPAEVWGWSFWLKLPIIHIDIYLSVGHGEKLPAQRR
jgi:hypothetical protein